MSDVRKKVRRRETPQEYSDRIEREKRKKEKLRLRKTNFVSFIFISLIVCLIVRVGYIKVIFGDEYEQISVSQRTNQTIERTITASRGNIIDRNGKVLASSSSVYRVFIDVIVIKKQEDLASEADKGKIKNNVANALEEILEIDKSVTLARFENSPEEDNNYTIVAENVTYSKAKELRNYLSEEGESLIGVHLEESNSRHYTYAGLASQVIGFIGGEGGSTNWGLENYYDNILTGIAGRYFTSYDGSRNIVNNDIEPINGNTLALTLDYELQQFTDNLVSKYGIQHGAENASIIVMEPNTGEVLAMSQYPNFNNNSPGNLSFFNDPSFHEIYDSLDDDDQERGEMIYKVWKNYNVSNTFEPGSIYKPLVIASALDENLISPHDTFQCNGYLEYEDNGEMKMIRCWIYNESGGGHGLLDVEGVLAESCNVGMMKVGEKIGKKIFYDYQEDFGYGSKTGIDLPGEEAAKDLITSYENIGVFELATGAFGQGFNGTPIQNLVAFNAVINGGNLLKPYVVSQIVDENNKIVKHNEPEVVRKVISTSTSNIIRQMLVRVVTEGTGRALAIDGYTIGGKTATGEQGIRGDGDYTVSFIGYIPVDNPQYIAIGVIDKPSDYQTNRTSAVPMMRELFLNLINHYKIPTDKELTSIKEGTNVIYVEDYVGRNVSDVVREINNRNYSYILVGSGDVVKSQVPQSGAVLADTTNIFIYLEESENSPTLVEIPDVVGMSEGIAIETLTGANLSYTVVIDNSDDENIGEDEIKYSVREQMPTSGARVPTGTEIRLYYNTTN